MPPMNLLIKPASGNCNMRCRYCFYADETQHWQSPMGSCMSQNVMTALIDKALTWAERECTFTFQGGEPTLAGLPFFQAFTDCVSAHPASKRLHVQYALQTNGYALDEEWAKWFAENHVLVGVSLDGPREIHDRCRVDTAGKGTFNQVMASICLLEKHGMPCGDYNTERAATQA